MPVVAGFFVYDQTEKFEFYCLCFIYSVVSGSSGLGFPI